MKRLVVLGVAGILVLAACGSDDSSTDSPPQTSPEGRVVEPRAGMAMAAPVPYDSVTTADDDTTLVVRYTTGVEPCSVLDSVDVVETDATVTVTLWIGSDPADPQAACILIAELVETHVELDAPLGERKVMDGARAVGS